MNVRVGLVAALGVMGLVGSRALATERWVPSPNYPTIQSAIGACSDGDEVVIEPNTYSGPGNYDLDFLGKAITVRSSDPNDPNVVAATVIDCEYDGRGFFFHHGEGPNSVLTGLTITRGFASASSGSHEGGGGVYCRNSSPTIARCTITDCTVPWSSPLYGGAGICLYGSNATIADCTIYRNYIAIGKGGGIRCYNSDPVIRGCRIIANRSNDVGGGISAENSNIELRSCIVSKNHPSGLSCWGGSPVLVANSAFVGNSSGGIRLYDSQATISNCIFLDNASILGTEISLTSAASPSTADIAYSDVQGGPNAVVVDPNCTLNWGDGNIDMDPMLGRDGRLLSGSPCIDAGDPGFSPEPGETDINGEPRVDEGRVDMGPDEFIDTDEDAMPDWWEETYFGNATAGSPDGNPDGDDRDNSFEYALASDPLMSPLSFYVDPNGDDAWDGLAPVWDGQHGPKSTIQGAVDACRMYEGDRITLGTGTYAGDGNRLVDFGGKAVTLTSTDPDDPNVVAATVIDNQGGGLGVASAGLWFRSAEEADTVVAGLMITNGASDVHVGVCCFMGSPTVRNCLITGNYVGVLGYGDCSSPSVVRCTIAHNGGGTGAGIDCAGRTAISACVVTSNENGGIRCGGQTTVANCLIAGNGSSSGWPIPPGGPGISVISYGAVAITNCTIAGNYQGGLSCSYDANAVLTNCIVWGNASGQISAGSSIVEVSYSDVEGGYAGPGNIDSDPCFVDPNGPDGDPNTWQDNDYHLSPNSPCVDAGDPNGEHSGQADIDGQGRENGVVDMGSDEYWADVNHVLTLKIGHDPWGDVALDPEPNDPNLPEYPAGTRVTLTAEPNEGKKFRKWTVWNANDANYFEIDTNNPITIVMSADRKVKAIFKCGGGGVGPLLLIGMAMLGMLALRRKR